MRRMKTGWRGWLQRLTLAIAFCTSRLMRIAEPCGNTPDLFPPPRPLLTVRSEFFHGWGEALVVGDSYLRFAIGGGGGTGAASAGQMGADE